MTFKWHEFTFIPSLWAVLPRGMSRPLHLYSGGIQLLQEDTHHLMIDTTPSKGWSLEKKKSKRLFFFHKNVKMFYTESLKTWRCPGWFHHGFQGSGLEVWLQHDFGSRLQVVGIHKIQILRFAILSLNFPRFPCWFPDSVGSPPHGSFEEHLVMNKMITQNRKSKNVWT